MEQPLTLHWQSAERYYTAMLAPDLFGGWVLVTDSGGRDSRGGRVQRKPMPDYPHGLDALRQLRHRRRREGYTLCSSSFTEFERIDAHSPDLRAAESAALQRVFLDWDISLDDQAVLLGIGSTALDSFLDGRPLPDEPVLLLRAKHLLAIHKALRLRLGHVPLIREWLRYPRVELNGRTPLDVMLGTLDDLSNLRGLVAQVSELAADCPGYRASQVTQTTTR
ncbi:MAG: DUF2384 domain-containing protein [Hydrogenophilales bacterium]|nr:DUF2384 domain-containing protein [Hydrogenophilales bacterium]